MGNRTAVAWAPVARPVAPTDAAILAEKLAARPPATHRPRWPRRQRRDQRDGRPAALRYLLWELGERRTETAAGAPAAWERLAWSSTVAPLEPGRVVRRRAKALPRRAGAWGRLERAGLRK